MAVERVLDAMDAGRCPHCAAEIRKRQQVACAVYISPAGTGCITAG